MKIVSFLAISLYFHYGKLYNVYNNLVFNIERKEIKMNIGKVIKSIRENKDISQKDLADKILISYSVMNRIESGKRPARDDEIKKIAKALNVSTDYLLGVTNDGHKQSPENEYTIPEEFTEARSAREYINKHQIFGSQGFDVDKLSDEEIVAFANELLQQMKMVSYKYKK